MIADHEAELRVALAEGILTNAEAVALGEEAARVLRSPLELLVERGKLSSETLAELRADRENARDPDETATLDPVKAAKAARENARAAELDDTARAAVGAARAGGAPAFPVTGWDRYQPIRFLGQGGMGMVFLARDARLHRNVAIKFVRGDDPASVPRFLTEARAQARVSHERVCKVYEVGEIQGQVFIAMAYIDGEPLGVLASQIGFEQKARVLRDVALGVHEAHRQGIVHRDLKPANIMVERTEDGELRPYVMDFGLARTLQGGATETGTVLGTPHYMSPEQARGEVTRLDRRSDVYSLGATLYSLLTGQPPISGSNALEVLSRIATEEPAMPRGMDRDIPVDLESIALKCLEKDRSARYDSARALADDLDRFLSGDPVQARAAGRWYRLRKRLSKHRRAVAATAVAATLVLAALGWGLQARGEAAERERLARRFTEDVERIESMARYSALSPLHDIRGDQAAIRAKMVDLEAEIRRAGPIALGPGEYALGRGYLAFGEDDKARRALEAAWGHGFHEPRAAYALALVIGHAYREQLAETAAIENKEQREAKKRDLERLYRDPALAYLRQSKGADVPSTAYVEALVALYEGRLDDALKQLDTIGGGLPWFYEAPALRGDILLARATERRDQGDRAGARADFAASRQALAMAEAVGESAPDVHVAMGELEYGAMVMELYGDDEEIRPLFERGEAAVRRALAASPDHVASLVLDARLLRRLAEHGSIRGEEVDALLEKAVTAAERARSAAPTEARVRMELGRVYWQWGKSRQDRNQDPSPQLARAIEAFEGIDAPLRDSDFHLQVGLTYKVWADYDAQIGADEAAHRDQAIEAFRTSVRLDDRGFDGWFNLGSTYFQRASGPRAGAPDEDAKQALAALSEARKRNPGHVLCDVQTGRVHRFLATRARARGEDARPELEAALEIYRHGLLVGAKLPYLHNGIGATLIEEAREAWDHGGEVDPLLDRARAAYEQAILAAPAQGVAYNNVGWALVQRAYYQRARGEDPGKTVDEAVIAIQRAIELLRAYADPWANLGMVHSIRASYALDHGSDPRASLAAAHAALDEALKRNPRDAQTHLYLGEVRATQARWDASKGPGRREDFEGAAAEYQKAIDAEPENDDSRVAFARFCGAWATTERAAGRDASEPLRRGLEQAERVLAARPDLADARIARAGLSLAQAEAESHPDERRRLGAKALDDLRPAFATNPHLERVFRREAALAQQLATTPG
jgi:serine/threonine-protein kinase